jgi:fructokinase
MELLWGVDLGGTKIEAAVLTRGGEVLARERISTGAEGGYDSIVFNIREIISRVNGIVGSVPAKLGMGTPGVIDPTTRLLKNSNTQCLNGRPIDKDVSLALGIPVVTANDANCFALAEAVLGAGRGNECVFGVIMGTGVGGGVVFGNKVRYGAQGISGEWGHNVIEWGGAPCYCGKAGCVEKVISGPGLEEFYRERSGRALPLDEILSQRTTDPHAEATAQRLAIFFGRAISVVINILDPDVIVLGGGVSHVPLLYSEGVEEVKKNVFNNRLTTKIVENELGDSAGVFGAAALVLAEGESFR